MDIYEILKVVSVVFGVVAAFGLIAYCLAIWFFSSVTYIEPIVCQPKHTHKFPKIDISVAYQCAKVGQVLSARK